MKKLKFHYLLPLLCLGLLVTGCKDDDENNSITITIDEPLNDEVLTECADVHVHIDIVATDENHEVEILLHPEGDVSDKILDVDLHEHDMTIDFFQSVDLCSYAAGTCFHLEVVACVDHDCDARETADVEFCLQ